jgi:peptidoglycan/LPS O-acetylase OafA/YrhL
MRRPDQVHESDVLADATRPLPPVLTLPDVPALRRGAGPVSPGTGRPRPARPSSAGARKDIQGLRAVAVLLVVLYHLRPDKLTGGFVGVDVFLVISGFLIVGSLGREAAATGTISLRDFYVRRIRRLLPASAVVLLATMAATVLLMPLSRWQATAQGVVASALQVQNWALAAGGGYDGATAAVSPLQHYWSLAVEEQFYIVTPWVLLLACWVARRRGWSRRSATVVAVGAVAGLSFAHSGTFSASEHDVAYFATTTRMWELALGGLLALVAPRLALPGRLARTAVWVGLLAIGVSALTFTTDLAFPGWVAAVPVLGSVLVILGGLPGTRPGLPTRLLGWRPVAWVGDISYSLYLWHWPVLVFFAFEVGRAPTKLEAPLLAAGCILLAALSTRFVERPFRAPSARRAAGTPRAAGRRRAYALAAVLTTATLLAGAGPWIFIEHRTADLASSRLDAQHPGGAQVLPAALPAPGGVPVIPDPAVATSDVALSTRKPCPPYDPRKPSAHVCALGDRTSHVDLVLVGDSHAGQFSTPLDAVARAQGWRLDGMVRNGCPFTAAPQVMGDAIDRDCADANRLTVGEILKRHPRVVVVSAMSLQGYERVLHWGWASRQDLVAGYRELWRPLLDAGIQVVVLRDPPLPDYVDPECVEQHGPGGRECAMTRSQAVDAQPDPQVAAAEGMAGVHVVDLTDHFCNRRTCPGVIGNVLVYRDNHLTDTFALSLAPALTDALVPLV